MSLAIISPCYRCTDAEGLIATAARVGLDIVLTDVGVQADGHNGNVQFYNLMPYLEQRTETHVLVCDCVDVAFLADRDEIMDKFEFFNSPMVVSAEHDQLAGMGTVGDELGKHPGYLKNLNIGLWMGDREYCIHTLRESHRLYKDKPEIANYGYDSPQAWMNQMLAWGGGPFFALDRNCNLFHSMNKTMQDITWIGKRLFNRATGTMPVALHFNGDKSLVNYRQTVDFLLRRD